METEKNIPLISVCIPCHNQAHFLDEAIKSALMQDYPNIEVVVLNDASTDDTEELSILEDERVKYLYSSEPSGTGGAFNKAIEASSGKYVVLLCSDDYFTNRFVLSDIVRAFESNKDIVHVSRYYYQFIDKENYPVRAWRCNNIIELANNPSGMAFRKESIEGLELSNLMFVEVANLVYDVMTKSKNKLAMIIPYDTVAVRIHQSISRTADYYRKRWTSSPIEEWSKRGGSRLLNDFTSLIQIKNYFEPSAVYKEAYNFIKLKPINAINPAFWFFFLVTIITPRFILLKIPEIYRRTWGKWTTKIVARGGHAR